MLSVFLSLSHLLSLSVCLSIRLCLSVSLSHSFSPSTPCTLRRSSFPPLRRLFLSVFCLLLHSLTTSCVLSLCNTVQIKVCLFSNHRLLTRSFPLVHKSSWFHVVSSSSPEITVFHQQVIFEFVHMFQHL